MRQSDVDLIRHVGQRVAVGDETLDRSDYVSLLIAVRGAAPFGSMLKDLGHSVAHDIRDQGDAFEYLERLVKQFRMAILFNKPFEVKVLFPIEDVAREFNGALQRLGIAGSLDIGDAAMLDRLAAGIASAVAGTTFTLKRAHARAHLGISPGGEYWVTIEMDRLPTGLENLAGVGVPWLISRKR